MTTERNELLSRLPVRNEGFPEPLSEVRALFSGISTETIREMTNLGMTPMVDALTGMRHCEWDETILRDYCQLWHIHALKFSRVQRLTDHLKSLQFYEHLTPQQEGQYPEERASQAAAILTVVMHQKELGVNGWYLIGTEPSIEHYPYIENAKLRELLITSHHDRETVLSFIVERNIFDGEELSRLLESSHSAITVGVL